MQSDPWPYTSQPNKGTDRPLKSSQSHPPPSPSSPPAPSSPPHQHIPTHWHCNCQGRFSQRGTWSVSRPAGHTLTVLLKLLYNDTLGLLQSPRSAGGHASGFRGHSCLQRIPRQAHRNTSAKVVFPPCARRSVFLPLAFPTVALIQTQSVTEANCAYVRRQSVKIYYHAMCPLCVRENEASRLPTSWPKTRSETPEWPPTMNENRVSDNSDTFPEYSTLQERKSGFGSIFVRSGFWQPRWEARGLHYPE